jgi:mannose-6-phosphate isomerase-like protein (cupin superfamily)
MELTDAADAECFRISPGDSVKLAVVRAPNGEHGSSVCFEVWDPGGAQPPNRHPRSEETFWFLQGEGVAESDGVQRPVRAGELLVLPPGSLHRITNTGVGRLYAITTMTPDDGFVALIRRGVPDTLDDDDLAVLRGRRIGL